MSARSWSLPAAALGAAALCVLLPSSPRAYTLLGHDLPLDQRDFRVFDNFQDAAANDNQVPDPNFPGATGATMAIWKGVVEWQSLPHGDGAGDPTQAELGSGGANFDATWQGETNGTGGLNDNVLSALSNCSGGITSFTEAPGADGWRIRFCDNTWTWSDGPGAILPTHFDIQGIAALQYGFALGLGPSGSPAATMNSNVSIGDTSRRSIELDDQLGIQAIYGVADPAKPRIDQLCVYGDQLRISGANFDAVDNAVWFTAAPGGDGTPLTVAGVPSDGTTLQLTIPAGAQPGDVLVRNEAVAGPASLSEAHPFRLTGGDAGCPACPTPIASYCQTSPNSVGAGMTMSFGGSASVSAEDLVLIALGGPPGQPGIFFYGELQTSLPFGDGVRCVGAGPAGTFRLPAIQVDAFGDATYPLDWGAPPVGSGPGQLQPGDVWNFQFWYRDPAAGMAGFNLSDALEVPCCD